MGLQIEVPAVLAEQILSRHGGRAYIVSQDDWNRVREVVKQNDVIYEQLKALDVKLTPFVVRDGNGVIVETISASVQKNRRKRRMRS